MKDSQQSLPQRTSRWFGAILAAGKGTRLRPLTDERPKPVVPWLDGPMLETAWKVMKQHDPVRIGLNAWYHAEYITQWATDAGIPQHQISEEEQLLGTGGGMRGIADALGVLKEDEVLVCWNGDIVACPNIEQIVQQLLSSTAQAVVVVRSRIDDEKGLGVAIENEALAGSVASMPDHGGNTHTHPTIRANSELSYAGILAVRTEALRAYPAQTSGCILRDILGPMLAEGANIGAYLYQGFFSDLGTPRRFFDASIRALEGDFLGVVTDGEYQKRAYPQGVAWVHRTATLGEGVDVVGNVIMGPRSEADSEVSLSKVLVHDHRITESHSKMILIGDGRVDFP